MKSALLLLCSLICAACSGAANLAAMHTTSEMVELGDAEAVRVVIVATAGDLSIDGGASALLEAKFRTSRDESRPDVHYEITEGRGELTVSNLARGNELSGRIESAWTLRFLDGVPLEMAIRLGMGDGQLNLGGLTLSRLHLINGSGTTTIDLRSEDQDDLLAAIDGGLGDLTLYLPSTRGVRVLVEPGLGDVHASGLRLDGRVYVNDAYMNNRAAPFMQIDVRGGSGGVTLHAGE